MAETLKLTGGIARAMHLIAFAGTAEAGNAALAFRGTTHVHGDQQLAILARKSGLAAPCGSVEARRERD